ncbi:MAG: RnfH family protein [Burkholderiales bacterium]|nr:RnfH family protein [Burkholderiales bacterium]
MPAESETFEVEVVYALPQKQWSKRIVLQPGATVRDAIERSGLLAACPELEGPDLMVGIWNRRSTLDAAVHADDRVEIYRPLTADPKEARRRRART